MLKKSGSWRRIFLCRLLPIAPLQFVWDGWVGCLRRWHEFTSRFDAHVKCDQHFTMHGYTVRFQKAAA